MCPEPGTGIATGIATGIETGIVAGRAPTRTPRPDRGVSVVEVLVAIAVSAVLLGVVATAAAVTMRAASASEARLVDAAAVQRLGRRLATDLAGATQVIALSDAMPCGQRCPPDPLVVGGVNIVQLSRLGADGRLVSTGYRAVDTDPTADVLDLRIVRVACREPAVADGVWECSTSEIAAAPVPDCAAVDEPVLPEWMLRVEMHPPAGAEPGSLEIGLRDPGAFCDPESGVRYADGGDAGFDRATFTAARTVPGGVLDPRAVPVVPAGPAGRCHGTLGVVVDRASNTSTTDAIRARGALVDLLAGTPLMVKPVAFASSATYAVAAAPHLLDMVDPAAVEIWRAHVEAPGSSLANRDWSGALWFATGARSPGVLTGTPGVDAPVDELLVIAAGQPTSASVFQDAQVRADGVRSAGTAITAVAVSTASPRMLQASTRPGLTQRRVWELVARVVTGEFQGTTFATPSDTGYTASTDAALTVIDEGLSVPANWIRAEAALRAWAAARCGGTVTVRVDVPEGAAPVAVEAIAAEDHDGRPLDLPVADPQMWPRASAFRVDPGDGGNVRLRLRPVPGPALVGLQPVGSDGGWSCRIDGVEVEPTTVASIADGPWAAPWYALDLEVTAASIVTCALATEASP